jgi:hypothetical protein
MQAPSGFGPSNSNPAFTTSDKAHYINLYPRTRSRSRSREVRKFPPHRRWKYLMRDAVNRNYLLVGEPKNERHRKIAS